MILEIYEHFKSEYPREGCGVIVNDNTFIPCTNIAEELDTFTICPEEFFDIKFKYNITAIVHNHINAPNTASESDLNNCKVLQIPYYIFSYPEMELNIVKPEEIKNAS